MLDEVPEHVERAWFDVYGLTVPKELKRRGVELTVVESIDLTAHPATIPAAQLSICERAVNCHNGGHDHRTTG
ncbi:MAG: hypothetical protein RIB65_15670 [Ilumatobacter fluminis]